MCGKKRCDYTKSDDLNGTWAKGGKWMVKDCQECAPEKTMEEESMVRDEGAMIKYETDKT